MVRRIFDDVMAHYDQKLGLGKCGPGGKTLHMGCTWESPEAGARVELAAFAFEDPISEQLDLEVMPLEPR